MKYVILTVTLLLIPLLCACVTRTVSLDGTQQYTSIQTAIDACFFSGDTVLVYPGRYVENINVNGHNITLASLYLNDPQQTYIDSTIIDGNLNSCISIVSGETVTITGFTLVNNEQNIIMSPNIAGGGINIDTNCTVYVSFCIIRNCLAKSGGGIAVSMNSSVFLSSVSIFDNRALRYGGGLSIGDAEQLIFDDNSPCSVYNNYASRGMDISISYAEYNPDLFEIFLSVGSVEINEPDNYFIVCLNVEATVSIAEGYIQQIDADLYVSPNGSDDESGLTEITPIKTIAYAMQKIKSNPVNSHTIHLAEGIYSYSDNGQILPFAIKSDVKLIGAGVDNTFIDGESNYAFIGGANSNNFFVSNIAFISCRFMYPDPIELTNCSDFGFSNCVFSNNIGHLASGLHLSGCNNVVIDNIVATETHTISDETSSIWLFECNGVYINNLLTTNNTITDPETNYLGVIIYDSDVIFRNSIFANNTAIDAWLFFYQNTYPEFDDYNLDMSNVLFTNNTVSNVDYVYCPIYMQNRFQPIRVNNVTIANNTTNTTLTKIFAYADIRNLISYNPDCPSEMYLRNNITSAGVQAEVNVSNSLFSGSTVNADLPNLVTFDECIFNGNPLFLGSVTDSLDVSQPEYYYLSENSPCINTGVADTTGMNLPLTDLAGNQRVWDGRIDMGCYEYGAPPVSNDDPEYPVPADRIILSTYPNPVYLNGSKGSYTFIEFTLPKKAKEPPIVEIYNLKGQKVRSITVSQSYNDMVRKAGLSKDVNTGGEFYSTVYDCKDMNSRKLASGIYIIKVIADGKHTSSKMTLLN